MYAACKWMVDLIVIAATQKGCGRRAKRLEHTMWHMDFEDVSLTAAFYSVKGEVQCANVSRAHIFFASSQVVPVA